MEERYRAEVCIATGQARRARVSCLHLESELATCFFKVARDDIAIDDIAMVILRQLVPTPLSSQLFCKMT